MPKADSSSPSVQELQEQLKHYADQQALLLRITRRIAQGGVLETLLPDVVSIAGEGLGADCLRIALLETGRSTLAFGTEGSESQATHDAPLLRYVAKNGVLEQRGTTSLDGDLLPLRENFRSVLALPLDARDTLIGVLWVGYTDPHRFGAWERNFLELLGGQVAIAIANAKTYEAAQRGHERLAAVLNSSVDPILVVDMRETLALLNPAAATALGVDTDELIGSSLETLTNIPDGETLIKLLRGEIETEGLEWASADNRAFAPRVYAMQDDSGRQAGKVLTLRDITRYKNMRENQAEFTSTVSHDLRLPLTYMKGYVDMLPMVGGINERQTTFLDKIQGGITQMTDLVEKILDASRLDPEGNYRLNREPCDVVKMVQEVVSTHTSGAEKKQQTLVAEVDEGLPILNLDDVLLRRALNNLTDNAIKYTPQSGRIVVRAVTHNDQLIISVQDSGKGISPEDQKTLFTRFKRIRTTDNIKVKGSGLGLYIVKRVAEHHGGDAWIESAPNEGSTFFIRIPMAGLNLLGSKS